MLIETIDARILSETDARLIAEMIVAIWPKPGRTVDTQTADLVAQWNDYDGPGPQYPRSFFIREGGRGIAHASAYPRTIETTEGKLTVLALARVCTAPAARGRKLGDAVVRAAFDLVDHGLYPFALFQTTPAVRPFYERFGAVAITNRFINSRAADPQADPFWSEVRMRYPKTGQWPADEIDLLGPGW